MATLSETSTLQRQDVKALIYGILFSLAFTIVIWASAPLVAPIEATFLEDQGASWYFWKLPNPTFLTRFVAWSTYLVHQVLIWYLIYYAQTKVKKYSTSLHKVNIAALGVNAFFIFVHYVRTLTTYDGLAQDVSIFSSQGSVIVLLVFVLIMENKRRGMFFGKKAPLKDEVVRFLRKYHGYYFAWAVIYTFHYHPMSYTIGHLWGFFYTFLLMLQGSLFYTRIHTNKYWMVVQEVLVLFHGTLVAIAVQGSSIWTMFLFGFLAMFVVTQMYGLGLARWLHYLIIGSTVLAMLLVYSGILVEGKTWIDLNEVVRIPLILYGLVFLFTWLIGGVMMLIPKERTETEG